MWPQGESRMAMRERDFSSCSPVASQSALHAASPYVLLGCPFTTRQALEGTTSPAYRGTLSADLLANGEAHSVDPRASPLTSLPLQRSLYRTWAGYGRTSHQLLHSQSGSTYSQGRKRQGQLLSSCFAVGCRRGESIHFAEVPRSFEPGSGGYLGSCRYRIIQHGHFGHWRERLADPNVPPPTGEDRSTGLWPCSSYTSSTGPYTPTVGSSGT